MYITVSVEWNSRNKDVENLHLWQHTLLSKSTKVVSNVQSSWNSSSTLPTMVHCNIFRIINWYLHREISPISHHKDAVGRSVSWAVGNVAGTQYMTWLCVLWLFNVPFNNISIIFRRVSFIGIGDLSTNRKPPRSVASY